jgi:XapX domain-containing protein
VTWLNALVLGAVIGAVFALVKLDVPAPRTFAGVAGIIGLWGGFTLAQAAVERWL